MTPQQPSHIEPSKHSTKEVDEFLRHVEGNVDVNRGAGSPAIKPNKALREDGKPDTDTPENPRAQGNPQRDGLTCWHHSPCSCVQRCSACSSCALFMLERPFTPRCFASLRSCATAYPPARRGVLQAARLPRLPARRRRNEDLSISRHRIIRTRCCHGSYSGWRFSP